MRRGFSTLQNAVSSAFGVILFRAISFLAIVGILFGYMEFGEYAIPSDKELSNAFAAVALGAGESRIDAGLALVGNRTVKKLLISGQDLSAFRPNYITYFASKHPSLHDLRGVFECCVEWSKIAQNTFQNARETRCWLKTEPSRQSIVVITSRQHMARALAIFSTVLSDRRLIPYPVLDDSVYRDHTHQERLRVNEYLKYLATSILLRIPFIGTNSEIFGAYAVECPELTELRVGGSKHWQTFSF
jgi:uncharacterized SAM-binding protein YcdF (DUF218 family)